jgi:hypothetical protein
MSCGSSNGSSTTVSKIKDRLLFDNAENGSVVILNIDTNPVVPFPSPVGALTMPETMLMAADRSYVLIYDDAAFSLSYFNTAQETVTSTLAVNYHTDSIVLSPDGKHAYAAVANIPEQNTPPGAVLSYDLTTGLSGALIPVQGARRLAISGDGKSLLVFSDGSNSINYINLTGTTLTAVPVAGFDHPYTAYFSSDNTTAYVLNCGPECSGATSSVQPVAITTTTQTPGVPLPVPGATIGNLIGTTLYVAGNDLTQPAGQQGTLSTVNVSNMTLTSSIALTDTTAKVNNDGLHVRMATFNNKLWIGSWNCSTNQCLSVVDLGSNSVTIPSSTGNVTSFAPSPLKKSMYVMQGAPVAGELYQFNQDTLTFTIPYDIVGNGWDVKLLDQ